MKKPVLALLTAAVLSGCAATNQALNDANTALSTVNTVLGGVSSPARGMPSTPSASPVQGFKRTSVAPGEWAAMTPVEPGVEYTLFVRKSANPPALEIAVAPSGPKQVYACVTNFGFGSPAFSQGLDSAQALSNSERNRVGIFLKGTGTWDGCGYITGPQRAFATEVPGWMDLKKPLTVTWPAGRIAVTLN